MSTRAPVDYLSYGLKPPKGRPGTSDCSFCGHAEDSHVYDSYDRQHRGCMALLCGDRAENRGRCALYTSQAQHAETTRWFVAYDQPVTVTPGEIADRIHAQNHPGEVHSLIHSCSCAHQAMWVLGLDKAGSN